MNPTAYIETSVVSYLAARPSKDVVVAAYQEVTREWWRDAGAAHIAIAAANGVEYLVTWSFRHIANALMRTRIEHACRQAGYEPPVICTPNELLETNHAEDAD